MPPETIGGGINDLIAITGNLSLDGTLNITALTGYSPWYLSPVHLHRHADAAQRRSDAWHDAFRLRLASTSTHGRPIR